MELEKFKIEFDVSFMTNIPGTFFDTDIAVEFEALNIDEAEESAMRAIMYQLLEVDNRVLRKVELLKIEHLDSEGNVLDTRIFNDTEDE